MSKCVWQKWKKDVENLRSGRVSLHVKCPKGYFTLIVYRVFSQRCGCRAMKTKGMVFRYTWVYSKEDTMAHTRRPVVTS